MLVFHPAEDATFYVGENARDNHALTKSAGKDAWFFHASDHPSPHGILVCAARPDAEVCRACATLLKERTRYHTLHVDMILRKHVRLSAVNVGQVEYLRGPASVWVV